MSYDDFCKCTFEEFEGICKAWREMADGQYRDAWERARTVAAIVIQPHLKRKITPQQLLPLPWDRKSRTIERAAPRLTAEERLRRFEEAARRLAAASGV